MSASITSLSFFGDSVRPPILSVPAETQWHQHLTPAALNVCVHYVSFILRATLRDPLFRVSRLRRSTEMIFLPSLSLLREVFSIHLTVLRHQHLTPAALNVCVHYVSFILRATLRDHLFLSVPAETYYGNDFPSFIIAASGSIFDSSNRPRKIRIQLMGQKTTLKENGGRNS
ncbi:hypothetical protein CEXT_29991 [Caerostris extrusa]|uniref:Uncharacterized protein n=1 Tax=Caerostris extrusa TaxID=172846 RepID=A0AAV4YEJ2_CAEEX|nr:hypothetical protein CEXT_29991 [Caerostris extrusa]